MWFQPFQAVSHADGSIDYEADRVLEILRFADEELARQEYYAG